MGNGAGLFDGPDPPVAPTVKAETGLRFLTIGAREFEMGR